MEDGIIMPHIVRIGGRPATYPWESFKIGSSFGVATKADLKRGLGAAKTYSRRHNLAWDVDWAPEAQGFRIWRRA